MATSEAYERKASALAGIRSIQKIVATAARSRVSRGSWSPLLPRARVTALRILLTIRMDAEVQAQAFEAGAGANAIMAAYHLIQSLQKLEEEWNARAKADRHFKAVAHPLNFNPGIIKGGDWASSVPAWVAPMNRRPSAVA